MAQGTRMAARTTPRPAMHDERHDDAQDGLENDRDDTEERGVPERVPESISGAGEDVGEVLHSDERLGVVDESSFGIQTGLAIEGLLHRLDDWDDDDDRQGDEGWRDES